MFGDEIECAVRRKFGAADSVRSLEWQPVRLVFVLRDDAAGVDFIWITYLPATRKGKQVVITGTRGIATLTPSDGCDLEIEQFDPRPQTLDRFGFKKGYQFTRLHLRWKGRAGKIEVVVRPALGRR